MNTVLDQENEPHFGEPRKRKIQYKEEEDNFWKWKEKKRFYSFGNIYNVTVHEHDLLRSCEWM